MSWPPAPKELPLHPPGNVRGEGGSAGAASYFGVISGGSMPSALVKFRMQESEAGVFVLNCSGGLSWEDRELLAFTVEKSLPADAARVRGVVLDLAGVEFVNSAGLGALFQLGQKLRSRGVRLAYCHVSPAFLRLFRAVGLDRTASVCGDVAEGIAALKGDAQAGGATTN